MIPSRIARGVGLGAGCGVHEAWSWAVGARGRKQLAMYGAPRAVNNKRELGEK